MKKRPSFTVGLTICFSALLVTGAAYAQTSKTTVISKTAYTKDKFAVAAKPAIPFKPLTMADLAKGGKGVDEKKLLTLPNKKQVTAGVYLKNMNILEKNLNEVGYSAVNNNSNEIVIATAKANAIRLEKSLPVSSIKTAKLSTTAVKDRFISTELKLGSTGFKAVSLAKLSPTNVTTFKATSNKQLVGLVKNSQLQLITSRLKSRLLAKSESFERGETFGPWDGEVAGFGGKLEGNYTLTAKADRISFDEDNFTTQEILSKIKNTDSKYTMGFNLKFSMKMPADITLEIPVVGAVGLPGYLDLYRFETNFVSNSNEDKKLESKILLKVADQILIDENKQISGDNYSVVKDEVTPAIRTKIGATDIYMYGLDALIPVDVNWTLGAGGSLNITMNRSGITGEIGPKITQSLFLEAGVAPDQFQDIVDVGVGGELRMIGCSMNYGAKTGLSWGGGSVILNNDVYSFLSLEFVRGKLFTFYRYPKFTCECSSFLCPELLNPNCYGIKTVKQYLIDTGPLFRQDFTLFDDDQSKTLDW